MNVPTSFNLDAEEDADLIRVLGQLRGRTRSEYIRAALRLKIGLDSRLQESGVHDTLMAQTDTLLKLEQILTEVRALKGALRQPRVEAPPAVDASELAELEAHLDAMLTL